MSLLPTSLYVFVWLVPAIFDSYFYVCRLVNCVIEKTRRREDVSIADAARAIGIPRKLIDLRHGKNLSGAFLGCVQ